LAKNPEYIKTIIQYSMFFLASGFMWLFRPFGPIVIRKWVYWLGSWNLRRNINRAFKFILPLIEDRAEKMASGARVDNIDIIQRLLEMEIPQSKEALPIRHAHRVLYLSFAASAVSSALILHTIHQTLTTPQYIKPLREEIAKALEAHDGWSEKALLNMPFLESYIREMLRLCPPSVCKQILAA